MYRALQSNPIFRGFDNAIVVMGVLLLLNVAIYFIAGNENPDVGYFVEQDNPMARLSWYPLYLLTFGMLIVYAKQALRTLLQNPLLYLLLFLSVLSIQNSVEPDVSFRRVFALAATVSVGIYFGVRADWKQTLRLIGIACAFFSVLQIVLILALPGVGIHQDVNAGAWRGMFGEKNALGANSALAGLVFVILGDIHRERRWFWRGFAALSFLLIFGSKSATSLIAFVGPAALYIFISATRNSPPARLMMLYLGISVIMAVIVASLFNPSLILDALGKDATLTGRTDIWKMTWNAVQDRPWTGYGYAAFWQTELGPSYIISSYLEWTVPSAHNTWIEQGLHMGLPGVVGLLLVCGSAFVKSLWAIFRLEFAVPFVIIAQLGIFSLSESTVFWWHNSLTCVLFVFSIIITSREFMKRKQMQQQTA